MLGKPRTSSQPWSSFYRAVGRRATSLTPQSRLGSAAKQFSLRVRLEETGEIFRLHNCRHETTLRELREELDLVSGIPYHFQRVCYLDQGVLMDDSTLAFHDIVPGGTLSMYIWPQDGWKELVFAAVEGDSSKLSCLGVTEDSLYRTPHSLLLTAEKLKEWIDDRAFVALYITAHRGHSEAVRFLLANGTSSQGRTPLGRTPLHAAAAAGQISTINLLLDHGAYLSDKDFKGETATDVARRLKILFIPALASPFTRERREIILTTNCDHKQKSLVRLSKRSKTTSSVVNSELSVMSQNLSAVILPMLRIVLLLIPGEESEPDFPVHQAG
ncbi:ankyrin repeat domain-containing protein 60 [Gracilinanus agilis]|uniref:ankyrin repeat domain-containing protein 60 n=1 Tax=Gracilinanus agilis TaxID=191870 RepID=UPI001CFE4EA1|nr:ankyrin repeat domain-containing protein 60 [Gracilinanus agilis]